MNKKIYEANVLSHQLEFIKSKKLYNLMSGGFGSGKTYALILKSLQDSFRFPGLRSLFCAETLPLLRDSAYREFLEVCPPKIVKYKREHPSIDVDFVNGSKTYFRSFDKEWKGKGTTYGAAYIEELTTLSEETFKQLRGRLRQAGMPLTRNAVTNPGGFSHWVYKNFIDSKTKFADKNCQVFYSKTSDNTFLPQTYLDDLEDLKRIDPDYYLRNVEGRWGVLTGLIYVLPKEFRKVLENVTYDTYIAGVDFGFGHPTGISCIGLVGERVQILEEVHRYKMTSKDIIDVCIVLQKKYNFDKIYCDSARPEIIEEMQQAGLPAFPCLKGAGSVYSGIMYVKSLIQSGNYYISPDCPYHLREIDSYIWDKSNTVKEVPLKINDHLMDADRYALYTYQIEKGVDISTEKLYEFQKTL